MRTATAEDRGRLGILRGDGTVATVLVHDNIRCPQHPKLRMRLSQHFQLRDIVNDQLREVWLVNLNRPHQERDRLRSPIGDLPVLWSGVLTIDGYPDARPELVVQRLPEGCTGAWPATKRAKPSIRNPGCA